MFKIRKFAPHDIKEVIEIYNYYVLTSASTFDKETPSHKEMKAKFNALLDQKMPILIAEKDKKVIGYAYTTPYRQRWGYRYSIEDSIFIDKNYIGQGIGAMLLNDLIEKAINLGYKQMVAIIGDSSNKASVNLHKKLGFNIIGQMPRIGRKFDRWLDNIIMQRSLEK